MDDKAIADMYKILSHAYYYYRSKIIEEHGEIRDKFEWLNSAPKKIQKEFIAGIKAAALLLEDEMKDVSLVNDIRIDNMSESAIIKFLEIKKSDILKGVVK